MAVVSSYFWPFVLSFAIEALVAVLLTGRDRVMVVGLFFINMMTNPAANLAFRTACYRGLLSGSPSSMVGIEGAVVLAEWGLLNYLFPGRSRAMLLLSLAMNSASWLTGLLLFR